MASTEPVRRDSPGRMGNRRMLALTAPFAALEGFDLACYGVTVPVLLTDPTLGIDTTSAGTVGSLVAIGMLVGATASAALTRRAGHLRLLLGGTGLFSLGMLACAVAPTVAAFGVSRFGVGIGLGIVLPTVTAYVADNSTTERRSRNIGIMTSGYVVGALLAPLLGAALLTTASWRWIYVIGAVPAFVLLPLAGKFLQRGRVESDHAGAEHADTTPRGRVADEAFGLRPLLRPGVRAATLLLWGVSFCGLLLVFGMSNWLPTILRDIGYSLGSSLLQTAVMWVGAGLGMIAGGYVADRVGIKPVAVVAFLAGSASLMLMSIQPALAVLFLLLFVSGLGFIGSQALTNAFVMSRYPQRLRGRAIGWALSAGRLGAILGPLLGGLILSSELGVQWAFYAFAVPGVLGAVLAVLVPVVRAGRATPSPLPVDGAADVPS